MKGETIVTIEGKRPTEQIRTEVLDELASSYLSGFAQMWRGLSKSALCTYTVIWISGLRTRFTAPRDTTMQDIQLAWKFANQWFGTDGELRFVVQGKQIMPQVSLGEIGQENLKIHAVLPIHGGGAKTDKVQSGPLDVTPGSIIGQSHQCVGYITYESRPTATSFP